MPSVQLMLRKPVKNEQIIQNCVIVRDLENMEILGAHLKGSVGILGTLHKVYYDLTIMLHT